MQQRGYDRDRQNRGCGEPLKTRIGAGWGMDGVTSAENLAMKACSRSLLLFSHCPGWDGNQDEYGEGRMGGARRDLRRCGRRKSLLCDRCCLLLFVTFSVVVTCWGLGGLPSPLWWCTALVARSLMLPCCYILDF